jgi:hypothetical protein
MPVGKKSPLKGDFLFLRAKPGNKLMGKIDNIKSNGGEIFGSKIF